MRLNNRPNDFSDDSAEKQPSRGLDIYRPVAETLVKEGFELIKTRDTGQKHGLVFLDNELKKKDFFEIKEESQRYMSFVEKIKSDYSLCSYVYKNFSYFRISSVVNSFLDSNSTKEKMDQRQ